LVGNCEDLAGSLSGLANTVITGATTVAAGTLVVAGQPVPEHCRVTGRMFERVSPVDAKTYAIGFEMRLPKAWNGRLLPPGQWRASTAAWYRQQQLRRRSDDEHAAAGLCRAELRRRP
jgi:hypothetical protein